jgi:hypothetical protein
LGAQPGTYQDYPTESEIERTTEPGIGRITEPGIGKRPHKSECKTWNIVKSRNKNEYGTV